MFSLIWGIQEVAQLSFVKTIQVILVLLQLKNPFKGSFTRQI
jgi:hypothetical protein